jgi:hypothetical protein
MESYVGSVQQLASINSSVSTSTSLLSLRSRPAARNTTTTTRLLGRRTVHRPVGTEDTTVSRLRLQQRMATGTFVEVNAGVGRHRLHGRRTAMRTGQYGFQNELRIRGRDT